MTSARRRPRRPTRQYTGWALRVDADAAEDHRMGPSGARSVDEVIDRLAGEFSNSPRSDVERLVRHAWWLFADAERDEDHRLRVAEWYVRIELTGRR